MEQKVHLVLDGAAYHQSELVKNAAKVLNIELHYLPPYSPNLNPIERLWKVMNEHVRNNIYFSSKPEFTSAIKEFFDVTLPEVAGTLVSRITDNFQIPIIRSRIKFGRWSLSVRLCCYFFYIKRSARQGA